MLASAVVTKARFILNDLGTPPRWADVTLLDYCDDMQMEVFRLRPDFALSTTAAMEIPSIDLLPDYLLLPAADYVVYRVFLADNSDTSNAQRAQTHMTNFLNALGVS
jgi:hypothetical protein